MESSAERQLRKLAEREGLTAIKSRRNGRWTILDPSEHHRVVLGHPDGVELEAAMSWLRALDDVAVGGEA